MYMLQQTLSYFFWQNDGEVLPKLCIPSSNFPFFEVLYKDCGVSLAGAYITTHDSFTVFWHDSCPR